jgi:hypothetical protein
MKQFHMETVFPDSLAGRWGLGAADRVHERATLPGTKGEDVATGYFIT